jgi:hypothetical protein
MFAARSRAAKGIGAGSPPRNLIRSFANPAKLLALHFCFVEAHPEDREVSAEEGTRIIPNSTARVEESHKTLDGGDTCIS